MIIVRYAGGLTHSHYWMRTISIALIMPLALAVNAWAQQPGTFMTGNTLLERCRSSDSWYYLNDQGYCHGYITGVFDQRLYSRWFAGLGVCPPISGLNETQVWDVVVNFLVANPAERGRPADELVAMAIGKAWGCGTAPGVPPSLTTRGR